MSGTIHIILPTSEIPERQFLGSRGESGLEKAEAAAQEMALANPGVRFYVCAVVAHAYVESLDAGS